MIERKYMERAMELAKKGIGYTNPNPMVGAVIVKDGKIIGEGYHERCGELHAERNAIAQLTEDAEGATIYVTLEPCCHYGKTPPCTEAIIEKKISRVVIGSRDPNPLVAGKGVKQLRDAGIEVIEDFCRAECDGMNEVFFHYITTKQPYVVMKYAMTADGKIATKTGDSKWITGEKAREHVQYLRHRYMGIMVGIGTLLADNPLLNCRIPNGKNPIRIICDSNLRIPVDCQIVETAKEIPTIVAVKKQEFTKEQKEKKEQLIKKQVEIIEVPEKEREIDLTKLMKILGEKGIDSILLEGGGILNDTALREELVKKVYVYMAPKMFGGSQSKTPVEGEGVSLAKEAYSFSIEQVQKIGEDIVIEMKNQDNCKNL
ncbi:MAG: bifunctional diaminohydroxyphosphoribosylaminopyrimidine deaminase/5-amino-6-(5-phosphoribosylamino)uracil reductase RibD [Lachnospiraceae bacterium]|nr:bifunctional diaminohydroxyphosphoribosylaminopyrimidine deaminase/5-amino-6-(5-phosphoribosylamino)uracil reductase RibD [Lachnospiraceae bacterium]